MHYVLIIVNRNSMNKYYKINIINKYSKFFLFYITNLKFYGNIKIINILLYY